MRLLILIGLLHAAGMCRAQDDSTRLQVSVLNENGEPTAARAWVEANNRRLFTPSDTKSATVYSRDESFSFDGSFIINVPAVTAVLHVEKGKEYLPVDLQLNLKSNEDTTRTVQLKRWIDMPSKGWYSADLHVHLGHNDTRVLKQLALADDVHLIPAFTYWLRGRGVWFAEWPDKETTLPLRIDDRHIITRNNLEIERINRQSEPGGTVGATFLYNLNQPVSASEHGEHFPTDTDLCRGALKHSPDVVFDSDKPSWAESVVGAALGTLHTMQVCHNHYSRRKTLDGGWGMIGPLAPDESNLAAKDGLFHRTDKLYHRFLNCGFRLGVSGGSAIGVMPMPTGWHRVYARVEGEFTAEKMWRAIKSGRSFATTGPMLFMKVGDQEVGATIDRASAITEPLNVSTKVKSMDALEAVEIIHNGKVLKRVDMRNQSLLINHTLGAQLLPQRSGWIASRALYRAPNGRLRQAHASPVYVTIDGKPVAFAEDARYMLRWLDVLEKIARSDSNRFPDPKSRDQVLRTYAEAGKKHEEIIRSAVGIWGD